MGVVYGNWLVFYVVAVEYVCVYVKMFGANMYAREVI